jgi:hypothetical protein
MVYTKWVRMKSFSLILLWLTMSAIILLIFCTPDIIFSAQKYYYYLHISSFRSEKRAIKDVKARRNQGYNAVIRREQLPNKEYWYRVYIGPFSSLQEARLKKEELISRKLSDYAVIKKKTSLIKTNIGKPPEEEERKVGLEPKKEAPEVSQAKELTLPPIEEPVKVPPVSEKPPEKKEASPPIPSVEKHEVVKAPSVMAPISPPERISAQPPPQKTEMVQKGSGRNMGRGDFGLGLGHMYRQVPLELTKRTSITSDGTTTTVEDIPVTIGENCFTRLHMDSLRARRGLTNDLEIFAEIGGAYLELSNMDFAYGGGLRLNLFQGKDGWFRGFYSALQGEFLSGEVEYEYSSTQGDKWKKAVDWEEFIVKGELGFVGHRFNAYIGATYFDYHEDTKRELLENFPSTLTSFVLQDELEDKERFGAFGGIAMNLRPAFFLNVEGQVITQKSVFLTLEYHF